MAHIKIRDPKTGEELGSVDDELETTKIKERWKEKKQKKKRKSKVKDNEDKNK